MGKDKTPPQPDHGPQVKACDSWHTIWPNLLNFVGPKQNKALIKQLVEAAIKCSLAEQHYQVMFYFNAALCKLEEFPQEAATPASTAKNKDDDDDKTPSSKSKQEKEEEDQQKKKSEETNNDSNSENKKASPVVGDDATPTELGHRAAIDFILNSKEFQSSSRKSKLGDSLLEEARMDNDTWKKVSQESNGDGVWYREEEGGLHSFKIIGTLEKTPMLDLACLLLELDLFKEWFPMCFRSKQTGAISRYERCATFEISCPWPMSNREAVLWGFAIDDLEATRRCLIVAEDHKSKIGHIEVPSTPKGAVRLAVKKCGYILEAVDATTTKVIFIGNIDPQMNMPNWLLNWATQKFCGVLMWQMHRGAKHAKKDPSSPYAERKKHDIYDEFKERVAAMNYEKSCEQMVRENQEKHQSVKPKMVPPLEKK